MDTLRSMFAHPGDEWDENYSPASAGMVGPELVMPSVPVRTCGQATMFVEPPADAPPMDDVFALPRNEVARYRMIPLDEAKASHLPRGKYRVVETETGWDVFTTDTDPSFT